MAGRYDYKELREKLNGTYTQKDVNALGDWFEQYGLDYWNGDYYDADGFHLYPVYNDDGSAEYIALDMRR